MTRFSPAYLEKIVNPDLAHAAMRTAEPYGEFKAYVRLAKPELFPTYMSKVVALNSPGLFKACISCDQIEHAADDNNVISIELREHISPGYT